ncbi:hypothetical protein [Dermacoccus nishinomiyaensis]|uniref:hypothetical protein n=1 Tax=Dermacoccus nishinomiyaensis TaxID=1274 RepID=UPI001643427F|nr:hypothetical protein [Dermacoccus nishinomiyaensis]
MWTQIAGEAVPGRATHLDGPPPPLAVLPPRVTLPPRAVLLPLAVRWSTLTA